MGARDRLEGEQQDRAWLAWHIEALHRSKKLMRYRDFARPASDRRAQNPDEIQAMFDLVAGAWGARPS